MVQVILSHSWEQSVGSLKRHRYFENVSPFSLEWWPCWSFCLKYSEYILAWPSHVFSSQSQAIIILRPRILHCAFFCWKERNFKASVGSWGAVRDLCCVQLYWKKSHDTFHLLGTCFMFWSWSQIIFLKSESETLFASHQARVTQGFSPSL